MSGGAAAQTRTEGRFHTGVVSWTPTLTLRDTGLDTNVYEEAATPKRDQVAVFAPQVDGLLRLAAADVRFGGTADFVYFQRYTTERSINTRGTVGFDLRGWRVRPFGRGSFLDSRERVNSEIDVRARRSDREVSGGLGLQVTARGVLEVAGRFSQSAFRQGEMFRGVDLAQRLNRETVGTNVRFVYDLTPLTRLLVEGAGSQDRFTLSPAYDADSMRVSAGFRFEPDALVDGHAIVGFRRIDPIGERAFGYEGITVAVELGYVLLQRTRFEVKIGRDTSYSFEAQPYFLQTNYGGQILHNLVGAVDVMGLVSRETIDYPGLPGLDGQELPADSLAITKYGGGVAIRPGERIQLTINYEYIERMSAFVLDRNYDRHRLYTNITYGF
jgi:hypothetical protein